MKLQNSYNECDATVDISYQMKKYRMNIAAVQETRRDRDGNGTDRQRELWWHRLLREFHVHVMRLCGFFFF